jgi:LmbE family N-acetylglucosaminyl deacetylase
MNAIIAKLNPLTLVSLCALGTVLLYLGRTQVHQSLLGAGRVVWSAFRLFARDMSRAEKRLRERNREVLLAEGASQVEKELEREFQRVESVVQRDLQNYPALHRQMSDLLTRLDEDYQQTASSPPSPPGWIEVATAVSKLSAADEKLTTTIFGEIKQEADRQHTSAMAAYRTQSKERHQRLERMMPFWRRLQKTLGNVEGNITSLHQRAAAIDARIEQFETIRKDPDRAAQHLSASAFTQFVISALVMVIAVGGAFINFNLIALPMSEMVGGGSRIGPFQTSSVAALVIILVEATMGLFLMECLRITRLFPLIGQLDDKLRVRLAWISFSILLTMAGIESALAFMRDQIAAANQALRQALSGMEAGSDSLIPMVGQMVLGFVLPFALTFVAIPLESFVHAGRTMLGVVACSVMRFFATLLRILGNLSLTISKLLTGLYDLLIFPLLWVETKAGRLRTVSPVPAEGPDLEEQILDEPTKKRTSRRRAKEGTE